MSANYFEMSCETNTSKIVVIELGEYQTKVGFAGQQEPLIIPTIMVDSGKPIFNIQQFSLLYSINRRRFFGNDAKSHLLTLSPYFVMKEKNRGDLVEFIKFCISQLLKNAPISEYGLLFLHKPTFNESDKQFLLDLFLHQIGFQSISFLQDNVAIMAALAKESATMVDLGESSTRVVSIYKNYPNIQANQDIPIGASTLTTELIKSIKNRIGSFEEHLLLPFLSEIKKSSFFVSQQPDADYEACKSDPESFIMNFDLPDNTDFSLDAERFMIPELYFRPELRDYRSNSIIEAIKQSIGAWERDQVPELLKNVMIYGGGSNIPGLKERLERELKKQFPSTLAISIFDYPNIPELSWVCGSASVAKKIVKNWITKGGNR